MPQLLFAYMLFILWVGVILELPTFVSHFMILSVSIVIVVRVGQKSSLLVSPKLLVIGSIASLLDGASTLLLFADRALDGMVVELNPIFSASIARNPVITLVLFAFVKLTILTLLLATYHPIPISRASGRTMRDSKLALQMRLEERMKARFFLALRYLARLLFLNGQVLSMDDIETLEPSIALIMAARKMNYLVYCAIIFLAAMSNLFLYLFLRSHSPRLASDSSSFFVACMIVLVGVRVAFGGHLVEFLARRRNAPRV